MLSIFTRILLFISSYFPLLIIITLQNWKAYGVWSLIPASIGAISLLGLATFLHFVSTTSPRVQQVVQVQRKDAEVMAYIVSYVFPFLGLNFEDPMNVISLGIFFAILGIIYINSNMIHINPTLNIFGYHIYEIETPSESTQTVISRKGRLIRGEKLNVVVIGDDLLMERDK
jgi:hypothetical protein